MQPDRNIVRGETGLTAAGEPQLSERPYTKILSNWLKAPVLKQSQVGVELMDLPSGQILFSSNGNKRFTPASTAKVFTTACALDTLGADFRYRTYLEAYGPIKKDRLAGDLVIVPSQDPTFETGNLCQLLSGLAAKKIKYIDGRVELAPVPGGYDQFNTSWLAEDWGQEWMPVSSNLVLDRNIAPGRDPGRGIPAIDMSRDDTRSALLGSLLRCDMAPGWVYMDTATRTARVSRSSAPTISAAASLVVANPDDYNLSVAQTIMHGMGIRYKTSQPSLHANESPQVVAEYYSKPVTEIIRECLKESDNLYAQQLLRTIGWKTRGARVPDTTTLEEGGLLHLRQWLTSLGVSREDVVLVDGCGLSRKNCVTPHSLNCVVKHMAGKDLHGVYIELLRLEGTNGSFFRYKTGAMDSVRTVTGLIHTAGGNTLALTVMVNGHLPQIGPVRSCIYSLTSQLEAMPAYHLAGAPVQEAPSESVAPEPARTQSKQSAGQSTSRPRRHKRRH